MDRAGPVVVGLVALVQAGSVAAFLVFAAEGDQLGIARAMALLLAAPLVLLTGPAILLLRRGHSFAATLLALGSLIGSAICWLLA